MSNLAEPQWEFVFGLFFFKKGKEIKDSKEEFVKAHSSIPSRSSWAIASLVTADARGTNTVLRGTREIRVNSA